MSADKPYALMVSTRIAGMVFLFVGCFVIYQAIRQISTEARAVFVFQKSVGTVTKYVAPDKTKENKLAGGQLRFAYTVDGKSYSNQLERSDREGFAWTRRLLATQHHEGKTVEVYYDPSDPEVCTLYLAVNPECFARIIFLAPFALIGLLALAVPYEFVRQRRGTAQHGNLAGNTLRDILYGAIGGYGNWAGVRGKFHRLADLCCLGGRIADCVDPAYRFLRGFLGFPSRVRHTLAPSSPHKPAPQGRRLSGRCLGLLVGDSHYSSGRY